MLFNLDFTIAQIFNPVAELLIPIKIPTIERKAEMETHPFTVETRTSKCSI